jgi:DNA-binding protein WhiA
MVRRKKDYVLYIKDSEAIEDILTFMGAQQSTLDIMNIKILKDVRNRANRIANCDAANIDKVIAASTRQIDDIMLIEENIGLSNISPDLREVAELRLDNPELSLKEIGELMAKPLQRSGVNRRFQKIAKIAEKIRSKNMKDNKTED